MDFHELEAFVHLARSGHFARAAAAANVSPSALSRILSRLEEAAGVQLAERDNRSFRLTEAGQVFLKFAQDSLARRDELHLMLGASDGVLRGTLRVFASVTACYSILPPLVRAMRGAHPDLKLSVVTGDPAEAEKLVREGGADLALAPLPEAGFKGLTGFSVQKTPMVLVAARDGDFGRLALDRPDQPGWARELGKTPLILPAHGLARDRFDRWARDTRLHARVAAEAAGNEAVLALARLGLGVGLVPRIVLENSPFSEGLVQYPAAAEIGDYDIGFVFLTGPRAVQGLAQALPALLEQVYPEGHWMAQR